MLAEFAARQADGPWNAFYLSAFITDAGRPTDTALNLLFFYPFSFPVLFSHLHSFPWFVLKGCIEF